MKWQNWRRSTNVEDFTDPNKPVKNIIEVFLSLAEAIGLANSKMAKDLGKDDIKPT